MKLIIDIPEEEYKRSKLTYNYDSRRMDNYSRIIGNGTPLDDVKAKILKRVDEHCARTLEIFDSIGKVESEE